MKKFIGIMMAVVMLTLTLSVGVSAQLDTCDCGYCSTSVNYYMWGPEECETLYVLNASGKICDVSVDTTNVWCNTSVSTYGGLNVAWASVTFYANYYWGDPYVCMWHN